MVTRGKKQQTSPQRTEKPSVLYNIPRHNVPNLSSTYQSFADTGPTNSYLDLCRARSDESLLWSASEEAEVIVAELQASINSPDIKHVISPKKDKRPSTLPGISDVSSIRSVSAQASPSWVKESSSTLRSRSFTDLHSVASSDEIFTFNSNVPYENYPNSGFNTLRRGYQLSSCSSEDINNANFENQRVATLKPFSGSWRSLLRVGGMGGRGKLPPPIVKKVAPPTVPDSSNTVNPRHSGSSFSSGVYSTGPDHRASFSSSLSDDSTNPPASPRSPVRVGGCDHGQLGIDRITRLNSISSTGNNNSTNSGTNSTTSNNNNGGIGQANNSPSHYHNSQFTFPNTQQFAHLMCNKTSPGSPHHGPTEGSYNYLPYQHQTSMEDQGIDVQSPGRSSPGSGSGSSTSGSSTSSNNCRNSTTSLDSGRASSSTHTQGHRLSGQSYDSGSMRHSYHSSSSSLGSMEHDNACHINVHELLTNGVKDSEVLKVWLNDLHFDEYLEKFVAAGYDMPTISRMTPEDLNAIGITKPVHRKKLKAEIMKLNISDGLPDFIPQRLEEWLSLLRLEEYLPALKQQNYSTVQQVTQITWEDLEDVGIKKLGHQKKVMLAIKRVKDIMAGKKFSSMPGNIPCSYPSSNIVISRENSETRDTYGNVADYRNYQNNSGYTGNEHDVGLNAPSDPGGQYNVNMHYGTQQNQFGANQQNNYKNSHGQVHPYHTNQHHLSVPGQQIHYRPDVVAVQIRPHGRGQSTESLEEPIYGTYQTFHPERFSYNQGQLSLGLGQRPAVPGGVSYSQQRSLDDGDITPTNEIAMVYEGGGGTLPRQRVSNKYRPIAKVTAKTRVDIHDIPQFAKDDMHKPEDKNVKNLNLIHTQGSLSTNNTPQGTPKKMPPPPPRRSNSISESTKDSNQYSYMRRGLSYGYMGVKNNLQPDITPDLPPPPAPQDSGNHHHLPEDFPPPPPPLTCITMANSARSGISNTVTTSINNNEGLQSQGHSPSDGESEPGCFRTRRNDSNASFKSNSSTDSADSLPFANDNAGTIKQRASRGHTGLSLLDSSSPRGSPISSPALRRKDAVNHMPYRPVGVATTTSAAPLQDSSAPTITTTACSKSIMTSSVKKMASSPEGTGDVLNDIGNMLANLTDELDAMLENELTLSN